MIIIIRLITESLDIFLVSFLLLKYLIPLFSLHYNIFYLMIYYYKLMIMVQKFNY